MIIPSSFILPIIIIFILFFIIIAFPKERNIDKKDIRNLKNVSDKLYLFEETTSPLVDHKKEEVSKNRKYGELGHHVTTIETSIKSYIFAAVLSCLFLGPFIFAIMKSGPIIDEAVEKYELTSVKIGMILTILAFLTFALIEFIIAIVYSKKIVFYRYGFIIKKSFMEEVYHIDDIRNITTSYYDYNLGEISKEEYDKLESRNKTFTCDINIKNGYKLHLISSEYDDLEDKISKFLQIVNLYI